MTWMQKKILAQWWLKPQATCSLGRHAPWEPHTNRDEIFFCILSYLNINDFSWCKGFYPLHYPTRDLLTRLGLLKQRFTNLHYHIKDLNAEKTRLSNGLNHYRFTMLNNSPRHWLNHQHKCYYHLKIKHTCIQKLEMNHLRQWWEQMVSNSCVISDHLRTLILMIIVHVVWKVKFSSYF